MYPCTYTMISVRVIAILIFNTNVSIHLSNSCHFITSFNLSTMAYIYWRFWNILNRTSRSILDKYGDKLGIHSILDMLHSSLCYFCYCYLFNINACLCLEHFTKSLFSCLLILAVASRLFSVMPELTVQRILFLIT